MGLHWRPFQTAGSGRVFWFIKCECQQWNYWLAYISLIWRSLKEVFEINRKESRPMLVFIVQIYVHWIMSEKSMKINSCCVFSSSWPRLVSKWLENLGTDRSSRCDEIDNQSLILIYVCYHHHDGHAYIESPMEDDCHVSSACYWRWQVWPAQLGWGNPGTFVSYLLQLQESSSVITGIIISLIIIITWT